VGAYLFLGGDCINRLKKKAETGLFVAWSIPFLHGFSVIFELAYAGFSFSALSVPKKVL